MALTELDLDAEPPVFALEVQENRVHVHLASGSLFGPHPFLALKTRDGRYFHDNFDVIEPGCHWTYVLDDQTLPANALERIGVGGAGRCGGYGIAVHDFGALTGEGHRGLP